MIAPVLFDGSGTPTYAVEDLTRGMVRSTDPETSVAAAADAKPTNEANRRLVLRLLKQYGWLTQFCPFVLMGRDSRFKQTAIGPRYPRLLRSGLIEHIEKRCPRSGAESNRVVLAYRLTFKGRLYLAQCDAETVEP